LGLLPIFDLASRPDAYGKRAYGVINIGLHEIGVMVRVSGETLALSLIVTEAQIGEIFDKVGWRSER
jgi:beta-alanine--pyruvate transaminase